MMISFGNMIKIVVLSICLTVVLSNLYFKQKEKTIFEYAFMEGQIASYNNDFAITIDECPEWKTSLWTDVENEYSTLKEYLEHLGKPINLK